MRRMHTISWIVIWMAVAATAPLAAKADGPDVVEAAPQADGGAESLRNEILELIALNSALKDENSQLQSGMASLQDELVQLRAQASAGQDEKSKLTSHVHALEADNADLKTRLAGTEQDMRALETTVSDLQRTSSDLETSKTTFENEKLELLQRLERANEDMKVLTEARVKAENDLVEAHAQAETDLVHLKNRVGELEQAVVPVWAQETSAQVWDSLQTGFAVVSDVACSVANQTRELSSDLLVKSSVFTQEVMSSPRFKNLEAQARQYASVSRVHLEDLSVWMRKQMAALAKDLCAIHMELAQFVQKAMQASPQLQPYADPRAVSILVTAMMLSPVFAILLPTCFWACRRSKKSTEQSSVSKPVGLKSKAGKQKPRPHADADKSSPVQHGEKAVIAQGGDRVKYGKPLTSRRKASK